MSEREERNCNLLFDYLRSILYDPQAKDLDIMELDEPYRRLGWGLQFLNHAVWEMQSYSESLARGNLSVTPPPRDNFLCENLKGVHANLNHLTWQAKQVAKGDYSQKVSYLGEFSTAFNTMTAQLEERESKLKQEIFKEKMERDLLELEAHMDPLTGIGNRNRFQNVMDILLKGETALTFCYCDLDQLKYVNDHFGHIEGDRYLCGFVSLMQENIRDDDVFTRIGGDEFGLILRDCDETVAHRKMDWIQKKFMEDHSAGYDRNFSYGIVHLPEGEHKITLNELLHQADQAMYEQKRQHREDREQADADDQMS